VEEAFEVFVLGTEFGIPAQSSRINQAVGKGQRVTGGFQGEHGFDPIAVLRQVQRFLCLGLAGMRGAWLLAIRGRSGSNRILNGIQRNQKSFLGFHLRAET